MNPKPINSKTRRGWTKAQKQKERREDDDDDEQKKLTFRRGRGGRRAELHFIDTQLMEDHDREMKRPSHAEKKKERRERAVHGTINKTVWEVLYSKFWFGGLNEQNYKFKGKPGIKLLSLLKTLLKVSKNKVPYILVQIIENTTTSGHFPYLCVGSH